MDTAPDRNIKQFIGLQYFSVIWESKSIASFSNDDLDASQNLQFHRKLSYSFTNSFWTMLSLMFKSKSMWLMTFSHFPH